MKIGKSKYSWHEFDGDLSDILFACIKKDDQLEGENFFTSVVSTYIVCMKEQQLLWTMLTILGMMVGGCKTQIMPYSALANLQADAKGMTVSYGSDSLQYGILRVPEGEGPFPVVAIIHGGCWLSAYNLSLMEAMATDLTNRGYATWNLEYRRVGNAGGGWPGTFLDIADGLDFLRMLSEDYPLDLDQVVIAGHSAGGHLALWAGSRTTIPAKSPIYRSNPIVPAGVVSLAGIVDLENYLVREGSGCGTTVSRLIGGFPEDMPERYRQTSPIYLPVTGVARTLITGKKDPIVSVSHVSRYVDAHPEAGEMIVNKKIGGIGHFEVIAPGSAAWPHIIESIENRIAPVEPPTDREIGQNINY